MPRHRLGGLQVSTVRFLAALSIAMAAAFVAVLPAKSEPKYFYLQALQQDTAAPHAFGVLDVHDTHGNLTGFIQINEPSNSDSQLWTEIPDSGQTPAGVHLQNKATGLCIGDNIGNVPQLTLLNCGIGETFWLEIPHAPAPTGAIFERVTKVTWPFSDIKVCIGKDPNNPGFAYPDVCSKKIPESAVWTATNEPIGTVSGGVTPDPAPPGPPPPPPIPPLRPTNCELSGIATCGLVGFTCNPLSAADKFVVSSGRIGVKVTSVQPQIGLITGTYLNQGAASVEVCATKSGQTACSDKIDVTFGKIVCTSPPPERSCETGEILCQGVCQRPGNPDCRQE